MKKNILISFASHIIISILYITTFSLTLIVENEYWPMLFLMCVLFVFALYFFAGRLFLKKLDKKIMSFFSASILGMLLLLLAIVSIFGYLKGKSSESNIPLIFVNPIGYSFAWTYGLLQQKRIWNSNDFYFYIIVPITSILPSIGLWLGMQSNKHNKELETEEEKANRKKKIIKYIKIIVPACIAIVMILIVNARIIQPPIKYNNGKKALESYNYTEAFSDFEQIPHYKDSSEILYKASLKYVASAAVGDIVYFGNYEQDKKIQNGKELIAWKVLKVENGKALLISQKSLDCIPFNKVNDNNTWENCSLRKWLNNEFISNAFKSNEQNAIVITEVINRTKPLYETDGGYKTKDKIYCLSIDEAKKYFQNDEARQTQNTRFSRAKVETDVYSENGNAYWWLRSPDEYAINASIIDGSGKICLSNSFMIDSPSVGVRPVLWINVKSDIFRH